MDTTPGYRNNGSTQGRKPRVWTQAVIVGRTVLVNVRCPIHGMGQAEFEAINGQRVQDVVTGARAMVIADHEDC